MDTATENPALEPTGFEQPQQIDYFGFQETHRYTFPDGLSWIEFRSMNEGEKKKFQAKTSRDMVLDRGGNARMKMDPGTERHELIHSCATNWNMVRNGVPVPFNKINLNDFLTLADPRVVEDLEKAIRKANPWLLADMTVEDIQREIDSLEEMKRTIEEREQGEDS